MNETFTDDTQRYLELEIEDVVNVIDTGGGGGGGDKPSANEIALIERTLTKADYPTITKIGAFAFARCSLTKVNFPEVTELADCAFYVCDMPTTFSFPKVLTLGEEVFSCNDTITEITQENFPLLTVLNAQCFKEMLALEKVDFTKVTKIEEKVFKKCVALQTLILRNDKMVTLEGEEIFSDTPIEQGTGSIYVPDALVDTYTADTNWSTYASVIKPLSEYAG